MQSVLDLKQSLYAAGCNPAYRLFEIGFLEIVDRRLANLVDVVTHTVNLAFCSGIAVE
jgi:hypothetical protein